MLNYFRPMLSRLVAAWVTGAAAYLAIKLGVEITEQTKQEIAAGGVAFLIALMQMVYAVAHRLIDKRVNPGDAASGHLAVVEKKETAQLKATEKAGER